MIVNVIIILTYVTVILIFIFATEHRRKIEREERDRMERIRKEQGWPMGLGSHRICVPGRKSWDLRLKMGRSGLEKIPLE